MEFLGDVEFMLNSMYQALYYAKPVAIVVGSLLGVMFFMLVAMSSKLKTIELQLNKLLGPEGEKEGEDDGKHDGINIQGDRSGS